MKKAIIILMLFLLFTGLMLFKKGLLKPEKINNLKGKRGPDRRGENYPGS